MVTYPEGFQATKPHDPFNNVFLQNHLINWNHYISTTIVFMVIKLGRMMIYLVGFLAIKSHDFLIM